MPVVVCWFNMNLGGHRRRAVGSAWQVGFGNLGGIIAAFVFEQDKPSGAPGADFALGYDCCLGFCCVSAAACVLYALSCWRANRERDRAVDGAPPESVSEEESAALGDLHPGYRYLL
ncbi:hypothetical protein E4U42_002373 [Claviceps africana]|uniref:Allantoate permease n=1 Tax=Claviceps africana TaxID=83212 RepID=A0A8K0JB16_9HYPO|nr:hypothetical protein E4U42_002373 [Claviceps africana]